MCDAADHNVPTRNSPNGLSNSLVAPGRAARCNKIITTTQAVREPVSTSSKQTSGFQKWPSGLGLDPGPSWPTVTAAVTEASIHGYLPVYARGPQPKLGLGQIETKTRL